MTLFSQKSSMQRSLRRCILRSVKKPRMKCTTLFQWAYFFFASSKFLPNQLCQPIVDTWSFKSRCVCGFSGLQRCRNDTFMTKNIFFIKSTRGCPFSVSNKSSHGLMIFVEKIIVLRKKWRIFSIKLTYKISSYSCLFMRNGKVYGLNFWQVYLHKSVLVYWSQVMCINKEINEFVIERIFMLEFIFSRCYQHGNCTLMDFNCSFPNM